MSIVSKALAPFFDLIGSDERLHAIFAIHGSEYILHHKEKEAPDSLLCLKTATIAEIIGKDSSTALYHLNLLEDGGLIERVPAIEKGKPILMWKITDRWVALAREFNLEQHVEVFLREYNSNLFPF